MTAPETANFLATVCVWLREPRRNESNVMLRGYFINLGLHCTPQEIVETIRLAIEDGEIDWTDTRWESRDPETLGLQAAEHGRSSEDPVWYRSGRAFFTE